MNGDEKSWALMKKYNIWDVRLTEKLYKRVLPWIRNHPHLGIYDEDDLLHCPNCAGTRLEKRGYAKTDQGLFQRYRCRCGKWMRGTKTVQPYQKTRGI
jgi:hypothetical protein